MGYFPDAPDFADMSGAELRAELREAEARAENGATPRDRSAGAIHADVVRQAIARFGMRPGHAYLKRRAKTKRPFRPKGQYETGL